MAASMSDHPLLSTVKEAFKKWDITGDGMISRYELHAALTKLGMREESVEKLFNTADLSRDGFLQLEEFMEWIFGDPLVVSSYCLKSAKEGLGAFNESHLRELENLQSPDGIEQVFYAVMIVFRDDADLSWQGVQRFVRQSPARFWKTIRGFDLQTVSPEVLDKLEAFISPETFRPSTFQSKSLLAAHLCKWVLAVASMRLKGSTLVEAQR
eukprot:TRINITY_DN18411_c0_g1_i1.p1 TRINITY_DN18411_c0_g1~~TRINITY_DN18411_c0_g1_i1.p1  ORF type:complete len:211 (-),score=43.79 TRINITY_DN18411_c0_g1_i1:244-876(-)